MSKGLEGAHLLKRAFNYLVNQFANRGRCLSHEWNIFYHSKFNNEPTEILEVLRILKGKERKEYNFCLVVCTGKRGWSARFAQTDTFRACLEI